MQGKLFRQFINVLFYVIYKKRNEYFLREKSICYYILFLYLRYIFALLINY